MYMCVRLCVCTYIYIYIHIHIYIIIFICIHIHTHIHSNAVSTSPVGRALDLRLCFYSQTEISLQWRSPQTGNAYICTYTCTCLMHRLHLKLSDRNPPQWCSTLTSNAYMHTYARTHLHTCTLGTCLKGGCTHTTYIHECVCTYINVCLCLYMHTYDHQRSL